MGPDLVAAQWVMTGTNHRQHDGTAADGESRCR